MVYSVTYLYKVQVVVHNVFFDSDSTNFIRYSYASEEWEVMSKQMCVSNNEKLASREIQIESHFDSLWRIQNNELKSHSGQ